MKKLQNGVAALLLLVLLCIASLPVLGAGESRVVDNAGLFTNNEIAQLEELAAKAIADTGVDFAIVTTYGFGGLDQYDFAQVFYDVYGWGVGKATGGVIMIIDMQEREMAVMAHGSVQKLFEGRELQSLLDDIWDELAGGRYMQAARVYLDGARGMVYKSVHPWKARFEIGFILLCLLVGALIAAGVVGIMLVMHRNSLPKAPAATAYYDPAGVRVTHAADVFVGTHTARRPIPKDPPPGSGGGGGGGMGRSFSGSSSGGTSFSGGSRKF